MLKLIKICINNVNKDILYLTIKNKNKKISKEGIKILKR